MIFVTVGEQLPFDRLVKAVDEWSATSGKEVFMQIGNSNWKPLHANHERFLSPADFEQKFSSAEIVVAHAGMGSIITAVEMNKPIIIMPRQNTLGEHRNDHQFATARRFASLGNVKVVYDECELKENLSKTLGILRKYQEAVSSTASGRLLAAIKHFVDKC